MDPERRSPSSTRGWWLLIGGAVVVVVGLGWIEKRVRHESTPATQEETTRRLFSTAPPEVRRLDDGAIEIRHDYFRRTTIRLDNEQAAQALFECLEQGIERSFGDGIEEWDGERVRGETRRVLDECMRLHDVALPLPPTLGGAGKRR